MRLAGVKDPEIILGSLALTHKLDEYFGK